MGFGGASIGGNGPQTVSVCEPGFTRCGSFFAWKATVLASALLLEMVEDQVIGHRKFILGVVRVPCPMVPLATSWALWRCDALHLGGLSAQR